MPVTHWKLPILPGCYAALALLLLAAGLTGCRAGFPAQTAPGAAPQAGGTLSTPEPPPARLPAPSISVTRTSAPPVAPDTAPPSAAAPAAVPPSAPSPTSALLEPAPRRLTEGGCCSGAFWSPDSQSVLFIDRPNPQAPAGLWRVPVTGGPPEFWTDRLGSYSPDFSLRAFPHGKTVQIERLADGALWTLANGGRAVSFSPDSSLVAWTAGQAGPPFDTAQRQVWVSRVDGTQARPVLDLIGGGLSGWLPDGRLLVNGRPDGEPGSQALWALRLPSAPGEPQTGSSAGGSPQRVELARAVRLRSVSVSPGGRWLAYTVTFSGDPAQDGLWVVEINGGQRRRIEPYGAFRWQSDDRLLLIPLELSTDPARPADQRLLSVDPAGGPAVPLASAAGLPLRIANGDWSVSPDGRWLVYLSADDLNLWVVALPE